MSTVVDELSRRFVATVGKKWTELERPRRDMIELTLAHSLRKLNDAASSDAKTIQQRTERVLQLLREARTLADVKRVMNDEAARGLQLDSFVILQLESGYLVETAQSYVRGTVRDAQALSQSYLEQALAQLDGQKLRPQVIEALLREAAGVALLAKDEAISYFVAQAGDLGLDKETVEAALGGDKSAADVLKTKLQEYAKKQMQEELDRLAGLTPGTVASAITSYEYGIEAKKKWDTASTSEKMQLALGMAKLVNKLANSDQLSLVIGYAEKGTQVVAAALALQAASGWGVALAGMQMAGALGGMTGDAKANDNQAVLTAIKQLMEYMQRQFEHLNARLDNIEHTLSQIQAAIGELQEDVNLANSRLEAVQLDLRLLQFQVTNVGRLVAARISHAAEGQCIALLTAQPQRVTDILLNCLTVHAQRVLNASDPLQTLAIGEPGAESKYDHIAAYLAPIEGLDTFRAVPWRSLTDALEVFEREQGNFCPIRRPVDFQEVILGARAFVDAYDYLIELDPKWNWGFLREYPGGLAMVSRHLADMNQQVMRAKGVEDYFKAPTMIQYVGRGWSSDLNTSDSAGNPNVHGLAGSTQSKSAYSPSSSVSLQAGKARILDPHAPLQLRLLQAAHAEMVNVSQAYQYFEMLVLLEVVDEAMRSTEASARTDFFAHWQIRLQQQPFEVLDTSDWRPDGVHKTSHLKPWPDKLPVGLTSGWSDNLSATSHFAPKFLLSMTGPGLLLSAASTAEIKIKGQLTVGGLSWTTKDGHQSIGFGSNVINISTFVYPFETGNANATTGLAPKRTSCTDIARVMFDNYPNTLALPPERLWFISATGGEYITGDAGPITPAVTDVCFSTFGPVALEVQQSLAAALQNARNIDDALAWLAGTASTARSLAIQYLRWLNEPSRVLRLIANALTRTFPHGDSTHPISDAKKYLEDALRRFERSCNLLRCVVAASSPASLEACAPLRGLIEPRRLDEVPPDSRQLMAQQPMLLGPSAIRDGASGRWSDVQERLDERIKTMPSFRFDDLVSEGFDYFERCISNIWKDCQARGFNLQLAKVHQDIERLKKDSEERSRSGLTMGRFTRRILGALLVVIALAATALYLSRTS